MPRRSEERYKAARDCLEARRVRRADQPRLLLESAERSEAVVSSGGSLATHVTEKWVPRAEIAPSRWTPHYLVNSHAAAILPISRQNKQNRPLKTARDSDASHQSPSLPRCSERVSEALRRVSRPVNEFYDWCEFKAEATDWLASHLCPV